MTRVLFVGQSYIVGESRKKLACLAGYPGIEIALIVPRTWEHESFGRYEFQPLALDEPLTIFPLPIHNNGRVFAYTYAPGQVWRIVRQFRPEILQVEQEPGSLALLEFTLLARMCHAKLIAFTWENAIEKQPGLRRWLEKIELSQVDHLLVGNSEAERIFRRRGYQQPVTLLPNVGVDPDHFAPCPAPARRRQLGLGERFVVGFAGRLVHEKGVIDLIEAFAQLPPESHLLFLGSGPLREALEKTARELGMAARVSFQPSVPHHEVREYLNCMDCLVLPSRSCPNVWKEQFGLVLAQAMACGVPVVGSDSGAIPEVIAEAGLIFPEGDVGGLRRCLLRLQGDTTLRAELSATGRARVEAHYTHQRIAEQTFAFYQQVMSSRP